VLVITRIKPSNSPTQIHDFIFYLINFVGQINHFFLYLNIITSVTNGILLLDRIVIGRKIFLEHKWNIWDSLYNSIIIYTYMAIFLIIETISKVIRLKRSNKPLMTSQDQMTICLFDHITPSNDLDILNSDDNLACR
jgi:hypothetical protein